MKRDMGRSTGYQIPPGPRGPATWQTLRSLSGRLESFPRLREQYGPTFSINMLPGPGRYVLFTKPEDIKEIFAADSAEFSGARGNEVLRAAMGDRSVMLNDADAHRKIRRYLMPAFSPAAVQGYRPLIEDITAAEVATWQPGQTTLALPAMSRITMESMLRIVFGVTDGARLDELRPRLLRLADVDPLVALGWMYPRLRALPPWRGHHTNLRAVDALIHAEIGDRAGPDRPEPGSDLLSQLLRVGATADDDSDGTVLASTLSREEIRDQLVTLVLAGYETTASALAWTLHELARHPAVQERAHQAADDGDEAYLEACVKESMRVHPIIDFVARTLTTDQTVGGWRLPAGVTVAPAIMLAGWNEDTYPDHRAFRPERFIDGSPPANTWIPFGDGVRRCVGAGFALMEGVVVLAEVLRRFRLTADHPAPNRLRNITNVPKDNAPVRLAARDHAN